MSKGENLKKRRKEFVPEAATEEVENEDPPNAVLSFIQDCVLYQSVKKCLEVIIVGSKFTVLVYVCFYLFILLMTMLTNTFFFPDGSPENIVFSYVCIFTDILDIVLGVTTLYLLLCKQIDKLDIDHLFCINIVNVVILLINMFKLSAVWVLTYHLHTSDYYMSAIHISTVHLLEVSVMVLFFIRVTVQTLFLVNMVILVKEEKRRRKEVNMTVKKCYITHKKKKGKGGVYYV